MNEDQDEKRFIQAYQNTTPRGRLRAGWRIVCNLLGDGQLRWAWAFVWILIIPSLYQVARPFFPLALLSACTAAVWVWAVLTSSPALFTASFALGAALIVTQYRPAAVEDESE